MRDEASLPRPQTWLELSQRHRTGHTLWHSHTWGCQRWRMRLWTAKYVTKQVRLCDLNVTFNLPKVLASMSLTPKFWPSIGNILWTAKHIMKHVRLWSQCDGQSDKGVGIHELDTTVLTRHWQYIMNCKAHYEACEVVMSMWIQPDKGAGIHELDTTVLTKHPGNEKQQLKKPVVSHAQTQSFIEFDRYQTTTHASPSSHVEYALPCTLARAQHRHHYQ